MATPFRDVFGIAASGGTVSNGVGLCLGLTVPELCKMADKYKYMNPMAGYPIKPKEKTMLYEVAMVKMVLKASVNSDRPGVDDEIVLPPTAVLADSESAAIVAATLQAGARLKGLDASMLRVVVRPFK